MKPSSTTLSPPPSSPPTSPLIPSHSLRHRPSHAARRSSYAAFRSLSPCPSSRYPSPRVLCLPSFLPLPMRSLLLGSMLSLCLLLISSPPLLAQYSCPLIHYEQAVLPSSHSLLPSSPSFSLSFINESPNLPLSFLDVHYSINGADTTNLRISPASPSSPSSSPSYPSSSPSFILQPDDQLDYFYTYRIDGVGLACDTHHFQVSGRELRLHGEAAEGMDRAGQGDSAPAGEATVMRALEPPTHVELPTLHSSNPTVVVPPMGEGAAATGGDAEVAAVVEPAHPGLAPGLAREAEVLDQNVGVCPLIPFKQEVQRREVGSDEWSLLFHNLSPSTPLDFLDVHFSINGGPTTNLRLFTDPIAAPSLPSNDVRALEGLVMTAGDQIDYSFTYGVKGAVREQAGKVRACNTERFSKTVGDK